MYKKNLIFHQENPNQKNQVCKTKGLETYLPLNSLLNHSSTARIRIQSCCQSQNPAKKPVDAWQTCGVEAPKTYAKSNQKLTEGRKLRKSLKKEPEIYFDRQ